MKHWWLKVNNLGFLRDFLLFQFVRFDLFGTIGLNKVFKTGLNKQKRKIKKRTLEPCDWNTSYMIKLIFFIKEIAPGLRLK